MTSETVSNVVDTRLRSYIRDQLETTLGPMLKDFRISMGNLAAERIDSSEDPVQDALVYAWQAFAAASGRETPTAAAEDERSESDPRYGAW